MEVGGLGRIGHVGAAGQHGIGRLGEEERLLAIGIATHLAGVLGVVATDAEDAAHREEPATSHGNRGDLRLIDDIAGHARAPFEKSRSVHAGAGPREQVPGVAGGGCAALKRHCEER